jgi:hypothetical protein
MALTAEDLLLGGEVRISVDIPPEVMDPSGEGGPEGATRVTIRPLCLVDLQRIQRASQDTESLTSLLMVQQALVEPRLTTDQVNRLHGGLVQFLLREINRVSGISLTGDELRQTVREPIARACFVLSREFGWTPQECAELTLGQVLLYLEMLVQRKGGGE